MAAVDLYWLPLGADGQFVKLNGRVYEALAARWQRRPARDLYHSALQVELPAGNVRGLAGAVHDLSGRERGRRAGTPTQSAVDDGLHRYRLERVQQSSARAALNPHVINASSRATIVQNVSCGAEPVYQRRRGRPSGR
jgi:hypothetical protein